MLIKRYGSRLRDCKWHNWKEFLSRLFFGIVRFFMFVFAIAFAAVLNFPCPCITNGQWQVGVLAVFLGWINMITFIKLVPRLGVYVLMFLNVIYSFLKMFLLGLLLVIAFGLAFYMLFRNPSELVCLWTKVLCNNYVDSCFYASSQRTAFATPARALIKAMTMPLANFDFDGMFHLSDDEDEIAYVGASYLMWIVFVIILAILFQNLLVSLPLYWWDSCNGRATVELIISVSLSLVSKPSKGECQLVSLQTSKKFLQWLQIKSSYMFD